MSFVNNSPLELHSADSANFECSQTSSLVSHSKFAENYESQTENPSVVDSTQSVESNKKIKSKKPLKSFCYFWLIPKVESPSISSLRDFMILYIQNNSSICGGGFVFARIFGIKTRLESVESQKFLQVRKMSPKTSEAKFPVKTNCPHSQRLNLAF